MPARHLDTGRLGEDAAAELLERAGLRIVERNLRLRRLEFDLVCEDGDTLVFVEVKTRAEGSLASPAQGLTAQKAARLVRAARDYLTRTDQWHRPCRFDFVGVLVRAGAVAQIRHEENVIENADSAGNAWQPW